MQLHWRKRDNITELADLLLWVYIINVPELLKNTLVFRLKETLVSFGEQQFTFVGNIADRP